MLFFLCYNIFVIYMKRKYLILFSLLFFLTFLFLYLLDSVNGIDDLFYKYIISIKSDRITNLMKFITFFGSTRFIIFLMILFFIIGLKKNKIFNFLNLIILGDVFINNLVKIIVRRERPILINLVNETSFSFPSGHTMISVTLYGFLIYLIIKSNMNKKIKIILISLLILLINSIIISRIYLGVHYFSDCLAGIFLALTYLLFSIEILERKKFV